MAGTPAAFQGFDNPSAIGGFQDDAFQTGEVVAGDDTIRLLPLLGVGFQFLFCVLWQLTSHTHS